MGNKKIGPYFDRCLAALGLSLVLCSSAFAAVENEYDDIYDPNYLVEVHVKADPNASYSVKKSDWSWRLSLTGEEFYPDKFISPADGASYTTIFGSNQGDLATVSLGAQYNTRVGGLYLEGQYGGGNIPGAKGTNGNMSMTKYGATIGYSLNTLQKDPWVSPFVAAQMVFFSWNETANGSTGTTQMTVGTVFGISLHLNKLDTEASKDAYESYGIKNTAFDIYAVQYDTSSSSKDPDFQTDFNVGAGFHFEF